MKFRAGDKVEFIYLGELKQGVVTEIRASNFDISYQVKTEFTGTLWVTERDLVAPATVLKVPQFIADWIELKKSNGDQLYIAMDKSWQSMNYKVIDWLEEGEDRYNKFARAWLDGYEVEKEPLYYVRLPLPFGYLRRSKLYPASQNVEDASKYSEKEIKAMDERYWQFAVLVEEVEGEQA
ncbi:DUF1642 domain-containing protein [Listeria monocytogenes]